LAVEAPAPPAGLSGPIAARWRELWTSELAPLIRSTDLPILTRLYEAYQDREDVRAEMHPKRTTPPRRRTGETHNAFEHRCAEYRRSQAMTKWVVFDDRGGVKTNPLVGILNAIDERIMQMEDRLALNPTARAKLGLVQIRGLTLQQQNALQLAEHPDDPPEDDPRVVLLKPPKGDRT
jgi:hypothetical protein